MRDGRTNIHKPAYALDSTCERDIVCVRLCTKHAFASQCVPANCRLAFTVPQGLLLKLRHL